MPQVEIALNAVMLARAEAAEAAGQYDKALEYIFAVMALAPCTEARILLFEVAISFLISPAVQSSFGPSLEERDRRFFRDGQMLLTISRPVLTRALRRSFRFDDFPTASLQKYLLLASKDILNDHRSSEPEHVAEITRLLHESCTAISFLMHDVKAILKASSQQDSA